MLFGGRVSSKHIRGSMKRLARLGLFSFVMLPVPVSFWPEDGWVRWWDLPIQLLRTIQQNHNKQLKVGGCGEELQIQLALILYICDDKQLLPVSKFPFLTIKHVLTHVNSQDETCADTCQLRVQIWIVMGHTFSLAPKNTHGALPHCSRFSVLNSPGHCPL